MQPAILTQLHARFTCGESPFRQKGPTLTISRDYTQIATPPPPTSAGPRNSPARDSVRYHASLPANGCRFEREPTKELTDLTLVSDRTTKQIRLARRNASEQQSSQLKTVRPVPFGVLLLCRASGMASAIRACDSVQRINTRNKQCGRDGGEITKGK